VADTGNGMSPEIQARAFEPFFTTKATGQGTGLGLSQVYGFAKQSGGTAVIESQLGKGTTVTLMLPRAHGKAISAELIEEPTPLKGSGRILVVEDDNNVGVVVTEMLEQLGYQTTRVSDGHDALKKLQQGKFDLVFSDIVMPGGINGIELCQVIHRRYPKTPVLLTTGYAGASIPPSYADLVLHKPYGPPELARAVARVLGNGRTSR
jgi:CheY-like chemotaxis protein